MAAAGLMAGGSLLSVGARAAGKNKINMQLGWLIGGNQIGEVLELHEALRPNAARARAIELLARTGIPEPERRVDAYPHELSGGQQQRVALARSIAKQPKLLLLDEPLGALDKKLRVSTQIELVNIIEEVGVTCVLVTHDQEEAMTMATRMAVMSAGSFLQVGSPKDIYQQPNSRQVADFIGSVNIFDGLVKQSPANSAQAPGIQVECADALLRVPSNQACHAGMAVGVAIRPEKIVLSRKKPTAKANHLAGVITEMAYFGAHTSYHVKLASGKVLQAQVQSHADEASADLSWGDQVYASWSDNAMVLLTQ